MSKRPPYSEPEPPATADEYVRLAHAVLEGRTVRATDEANAKALANGVLLFAEAARVSPGKENE